MKERSWVYAKILFLILSINLFLCTDIVECTERLLTIVNLSLGENNLWLVGEARKHIIEGDFPAWKRQMLHDVQVRL